MTATDEGDVRIVFTDADKSNRRTIWEGPTELLDASALMTEQLLVPFSGAELGEDDKLIVEVKVGVTSSADYGANTKVRIPITKKNLATKQKTPTFLRDSDLRAADVTLTADVWVELGVYTIGAQTKLRLGHQIPNNSKIYISMVENE